MILIVLFFSLLVVLADAESNGYKSYKNYKVFEIAGSPESVSDFRAHMETNESVDGDNEAVFVWGSGHMLHALVPEARLGHVHATLRQRNLTATLLQHDSVVGESEAVFVWGSRHMLHALIPEGRLRHVHAALRQRNLTATLLLHDVSQYCVEQANSRRTKEFGWSAYYDVDDIYAYLRNMSAWYPAWAAPVVGGRSYEGREILGLRVRKPGSVSQPAIFIESGIHAEEWITSATITYFINELLTSNDPNMTALRDNFDWHIFPLVNTDGYHYSMNNDVMWRKTRSKSPNGCFGADPNRNWDYKWDLALNASSDPCDNRYTGPRPFSEVETCTLASYITAVENLQGYLAFHSNAQMLLVPYSDSKEHLDNYDDLIQVGKATLEYGRRVNGAKYDGVGTAAEMLYPASGGSMDWVRHTLRTPLVYTWELRGWALPCWPAARIPEQGDEVTQMIHGLTVEARKLGYLK